MAPGNQALPDPHPTSARLWGLICILSSGLYVLFVTLLCKTPRRADQEYPSRAILKVAQKMHVLGWEFHTAFNDIL